MFNEIAAILIVFGFLYGMNDILERLQIWLNKRKLSK